MKLLKLWDFPERPRETYGSDIPSLLGTSTHLHRDGNTIEPVQSSGIPKFVYSAILRTICVVITHDLTPQARRYIIISGPRTRDQPWDA